MRPSEPVVLITGATGGLGRVAAGTFARSGARLVLAGSDAARLDALAGELGLAEDAWVPAVADLTERDQAREAIRQVLARTGRIDILLHLVGGFVGGTPTTTLDPSELEGMLDQHLWSTLHVTQAIVPGMAERGWGRVVAVTSTTTSNPGPTGASYVIAKVAEETLLHSLAREVGGQGVTVNVLAVRAIDTEHERETAPSSKNASWTTPEELVGAIEFLCSDDAAAVNGARIALDLRS